MLYLYIFGYTLLSLKSLIITLLSLIIEYFRATMTLFMSLVKSLYSKAKFKLRDFILRSVVLLFITFFCALLCHVMLFFFMLCHM